MIQHKTPEYLRVPQIGCYIKDNNVLYVDHSLIGELGIMKKVDEIRLESDSGYRFGYVTEFVGFGADDIAAIHGLAPLLAPLVPTLVDAVYDKLHQYECTWRHFVPRQHGYEGAIPASPSELGMDHPQIKFRKQHLARYLEALVTRPYDANMLGYLDMVGKIHTPKAGSKDIVVPLVQMNALMGFVSDALLATLLSAPVSPEVKAQAIRSVNKLLWLQNDLITRHYAN